MKMGRRNLILVILSAILLVGFIVALLVLNAIGFLQENNFVEALLIAATILAAALFAITLFAFFSQYTLLKSLQIENEFILGQRVAFNNLYAFQKRSNSLASSVFRKKLPQHIMAFTVSNLIVAQNVNRNNEIFILNSHLVDFLARLPKEILKGKKRDFVFGFSRGAFLIYAFRQNEQTLQHISEIISDEIYSFASKECTHLWVQPFFGITAVEKDKPIPYQVENALLARDFSEKNFETITYYQPSFRKSVAANDIQELQEALDRGEFVVFYQPKYDLNKKQFVSAEALIRWNSQKYGLLAPTKFLGKAEAMGLIHEIDTYVLTKVCEDLNDLRKRGKRMMPVSVNFSLYEFYSSNFLDTIIETLEKYDIPTNLVEIEITEATSQANQFLSISIIKKLKEKGVRVLMDDFGVGFSNIGNLKKIPFDCIKIDKTFIDDITADMKSREIVKFLINLCKINGMEVIAEGVDNKEQVELLKKAKCDIIQGFYYSKPISKVDYEKFLMDNPFEKKEVDKA